MKKNITFIALLFILSACSEPCKYKIIDSAGTYWQKTNSYTEDGNCVEFVNFRNEKKRYCGSYSIVKNKYLK